MASRDVVQRYFDMWNTGDTSTIADIIAPSWIDHAHPDVTGPDGVRSSIAEIKAMQPRLHFDIDAILGDDDLVAVAGSVHGAATRLMWLIRVEDGLMVEMWTYRS